MDTARPESPLRYAPLMSSPPRWLLLIAALCAGPLLAEGLATWRYGSSRPMPAMFAQTVDGRIGLQPNTMVKGRTPSGTPYAIHIGPDGHRQPAPANPAWLLTGDSLAFGLGVDDDATAAAHLTHQGIATRTIGAPGYSLQDALTEAHLTLGSHPDVQGVFVWVNPVDDDRQLRPGPDFARDVVAGHVVQADTPALLRLVLDSPLAHSHVVSTLVSGIGMLRLIDNHGYSVVGMGTADDGGWADFHALGEQVAAFARQHPCVAVVPVWVPLPGTSVPDRPRPSALERSVLPLDDTAARAGFRDGLGDVPLLDLSAPFTNRPDAYLPADTHLSPTGHALLAHLLADATTHSPTSCP